MEGLGCWGGEGGLEYLNVRIIHLSCGSIV